MLSMIFLIFHAQGLMYDARPITAIYVTYIQYVLCRYDTRKNLVNIYTAVACQHNRITLLRENSTSDGMLFTICIVLIIQKK